MMTLCPLLRQGAVVTRPESDRQLSSYQHRSDLLQISNNTHTPATVPSAKSTKYHNLCYPLPIHIYQIIWLWFCQNRSDNVSDKKPLNLLHKLKYSILSDPLAIRLDPPILASTPYTSTGRFIWPIASSDNARSTAGPLDTEPVRQALERASITSNRRDRTRKPHQQSEW